MVELSFLERNDLQGDFSDYQSRESALDDLVDDGRFGICVAKSILLGGRSSSASNNAIADEWKKYVLCCYSKMNGEGA